MLFGQYGVFISDANTTGEDATDVPIKKMLIVHNITKIALEGKPLVLFLRCETFLPKEGNAFYKVTNL